MKIIHCCLATPYIDNYGYQENNLSQTHKAQGHEVMIVASCRSAAKGELTNFVDRGEYYTKDQITVVRLPYISYMPRLAASKLGLYKGVYDVLEKFQPDVIFLHNFQFLSINTILRYAKKNPHVKLYADSHSDNITVARTWLSKNVQHRIIHKYFAVRRAIPHIHKFYGTTPNRVDYMIDMYGIPKEKTEFLPMGVYDLGVDFSNRAQIRSDIRQKLGVEDDDFVLITGGRIREKKNIHLLLQAYKRIDNKKLKLIVFGATTPEFSAIIDRLINDDHRVIYLGWLSAEETYKYYFASDMAVFPGTHSTLWEEAAGVGLPIIFKYFKGMTHVVMDGNAVILYDVSIEKIQETITNIVNNKSIYDSMKKRALEPQLLRFFSYQDIAKRAVNIK